MRLVLHIGTHKTGTTAIQRFLSQNREQLMQMGYCYPKYSDILPGKSDHYAHIDVAKGLMGQSKILSVEDSKDFLRGVVTFAEKKNAHTILISAESFVRGMSGTSSKKWNQIESFIRLVKSCIPLENIEITVTIRSLASYLTSLYNEHVKVTGYSKDIKHFHSDFRERFNYPLILEKWSKYFPNIHCLQYEKLGKGTNFIKNWVQETLGKIDLASLDFTDSPRNVSWPLDFVAVKREMNAQLSSNARTKLRNKITEYISNTDTKTSNDKVKSWLTTEEMAQIIRSHEQSFIEILPKYGVDVEMVLQNIPVSSSSIFESVSPDLYKSLLKEMLNEKK